MKTNAILQIIITLINLFLMKNNEVDEREHKARHRTFSSLDYMGGSQPQDLYLQQLIKFLPVSLL
jgi:hypothetical protein